jgi:hypothetical protein
MVGLLLLLLVVVVPVVPDVVVVLPDVVVVLPDVVVVLPDVVVVLPDVVVVVVPPLALQDNVGTLLVPLHEPRPPKLVLAPAATAPLSLRLVAVTSAPLWVTVAFQAWLTVWPLAYAQPTVHPVMAEELLLVTVTDRWKPPVHWDVTE